MISKTFRISERVNFEFRSFGSAAFGTIASAGNPRDFEFAGKIRF
jgi:hypothetical protein